MKSIFQLITLIMTIIHTSFATADTIYVIANVNSPINTITEENLKRLFLSVNPHFENGTKAKPYDSSNNRVFRAFYKSIAGKSRFQIKSYWSEMIFSGKGLPPAMLSSDSKLLEVALNTPNFIGYTNSKPDDNFKVLRVIHY